MADNIIAPSKACTKCGETKPKTEDFFHRDGACFKGKCIPCRRQSARDNWAKVAGPAWREKNAADPSRRIAVSTAWRRANPEKQAEYARRKHAKVQANPRAKLSRNISCHIYQHLRGTKSGRRWQALVGYTVEDLRRHLERQFLPGMTWGNYGDWHIDHIQPVSSFGFESPDSPEFLACWALTNLRPLWARDNIMKANRRVSLL